MKNRNQKSEIRSQRIENRRQKTENREQRTENREQGFLSSHFCLLFSVFCLLSSVFCPLFSISYAQPVSSAELIDNAQQFDGKTVVYKGEVIGDCMSRGEYAWINVNDGVNAIGVWVKTSLIKDIIYTGSHKSQGDIVEAEGVFNRSCPEHGGDLDIHARALRRIGPGMAITEKIDMGKRNLVLILLGALCLITVLKPLGRN